MQQHVIITATIAQSLWFGFVRTKLASLQASVWLLY